MITFTYEHKVHKALAAGRILRGWTQAQMAELMAEATDDDGWITDRITAVENDRRNVSPEELRTFAELQGFDVEFYWYGPPQNRRGTLRDLDRAKGLSLKADDHNKWADWALILKSDRLAQDLDEYDFDHNGRLVHKSWLYTDPPADLQSERLPTFEAA